MTSPRSPRGRLDHKASPSTATAKGSAGDTAVGRILLELGWFDIADLARTYPGADLIAFCACPKKHELWAEVKTYSMGKIKADSWEHMETRMDAVLARPDAEFALFTYQRANGRPKAGKGKEWWVSLPSFTYSLENQSPLISLREYLRPPCATGSTLVSAPPYPRGVLESSALPAPEEE